MRRLIAAEFMTIDGVIRREEADGDGFKYGGWFFPVTVRGDGRPGAGAASQALGLRFTTETQRARRFLNRLCR